MDEAVRRWFLDRRTSGWTSFFRAVTDLGDGTLLVPLIVAVVLALVCRRPRAWPAAGAFVAANLGASVLSRSLKWVVDRPRPPLDTHLVAVDSPSFPSGHATQAAAFWGALAVLVLLSNQPVRRRVAVAVVAGLIVLTVGVSRLYLGVHWASDIAGSYLLVAAWFALLGAGALTYRRLRSGGGSRRR